VKGDRHPCKVRMKGTHGFTLIEVLIVMVIVGILATGVVYMFANPSAIVKSETFNFLGEVNRARSEAVNRNVNVLIDFLHNVPEACETNIAACVDDSADYDGYIICVDENDDGECGGSDEIIKVSLLNINVQFYNFDDDDNVKNAVNGPDEKPDGSGEVLIMDDGPDVDSDNDGVTLKGTNDVYYENIYYTPQGTAVVDASIPAVFLKETGSYFILYNRKHSNMRNKVFSLTLSSGTGRARITRWMGGAPDGTWTRKYK
jgi:prepilin-type N-terminal cleavage/methylation domain-containing protein